MGQALETVTVQHERAKSPKQVRISARVRRCIDLMVGEGMKRCDAATAAGLTDNALYIALRKPEVLAYRNERMRVVRESAASRTIAKAESLMDSAASEHVQADMTKWLAGLEGISPITKSETINHHNGLTPGLTINLVVGQADGSQALLIDGQPLQVGSGNRPNGLPQSVPHPSMRNAPKPPEIAPSPSRRPRGEK